MTEQVTLTFGDATTLNLRVITDTLKISWHFDGIEIARQPNKIGVTNDPNYNYRRVEFSAHMTATEIVDSLDAKLRPAAAPTYDATDPKVKVYMGGTKYLEFLCAILEPVVATHLSGEESSVKFVLTERTT